MCECENSKKFVETNEIQKLLQFLFGLNDTYLGVRTNILMMKPLMNLNTVYYILIQDETQRSMGDNSIPDNPTVLYSTRPQFKDHTYPPMQLVSIAKNVLITRTMFQAASRVIIFVLSISSSIQESSISFFCYYLH